MMLVLIVYAFTVWPSTRRDGHAGNAAQGADRHRRRRPLAALASASSTPSIRPISCRRSLISQREMDARMDAGLDTFALDIPPDFQRDVLAGRNPAIQLNVDATRMSQAFTGSGYIQTIVNGEVRAFLQGYRANRHAAGRSGPAGALQSRT